MLHLLYPFLYDDLLGDLLGDELPARVLLYGGCGLGKTTLLRRLHEHLVPGSASKENPPERTPQATWVDRRTAEPTARIVHWCLRPRGTLIVDDFGQLFTPEVDDAILSLSAAQDSRYRVVVASRKPPRVLEREVLQARVAAGGAKATPWDESRAIPTFRSTRLNPWQGDWRARFDAVHQTARLRLRQEVRSRVPEPQAEAALALLPSKAAVTAWVELVRQVTGGHPGLVDGSYDLFLHLVLNDLVSRGGLSEQDELLLAQRKRSLLSTQARMSDFGLVGEAAPEQGEQQHGRLVVLLEDYLLERQMAPMQSTLDHLRLSEPKAFEALHALAEAPDDILVEDGRHRLLLLDTGVVYKDDASCHLRLPKGLVSEAIRAMDPVTHHGTANGGTAEQAIIPGPPEEVVLSITVSEGPTEDSGDVVVETTAGTRLVPLRGRPWQVFDFFWKHRDRHVPPEELLEPLEIPSVYSSRNAILRLKEALRAGGVEQVLENRKGVGYRVVEGDGRGGAVGSG